MRLEAGGGEEGQKKKKKKEQGEKDKVATRVWNMKPLGWGEYWEAVCAVREGGKRNHARRRKRRRCRTMTDSFLAGTICHDAIGRKIGERRWGGAQRGEGSGSRWWQR